MTDKVWEENISLLETYENTTSKTTQVDKDLQLTSLSLGLAMVICCSIGLVGNLLSIRIFTHPTMRSSVNVLLTGLSGIDFFMLILVIPVFALPCLAAYYSNSPLSRALPYITTYLYPFVIMAQSSSVWTFVAITVERWLAICMPLKSISICTIGNAKKSLLIIYVLAVVYNLVRFGEYKLVEHVYNESNSMRRFVDTQLDLRANYYYNWIYFIGLYLITHFVVPFSILLLFNFLMIVTILKAKAKRKCLSRKEKSEQKTTVMMIVVVLVFLLCNSMPMIINIMEAFNPNLFSDHQTMLLGYLLNDICNLMVVVNSTINLVTYSVFSQKYRKLLKAYLSRNSTLVRQTTERQMSETACTLLDSKYDIRDEYNGSSVRYSRYLQRRMAFSCHTRRSSNAIYLAKLRTQHKSFASNIIQKNFRC